MLAGLGAQLPFFVVNSDGEELRQVSAYLRDLMLGDVSPLTCRSYAFDLLRWHRLLWCLGIGWEKATEAEVAAMVGWLRAARNPQRERRQPGSAPAGSVNLKTGKPSLRAGYAPATINHALTVVQRLLLLPRSFPGWPGGQPGACLARSGGRCWRTAARWSRSRSCAGHDCGSGFLSRHRDRSRMQLWDELLAAMGCDRDRALLEFYVSSGARASELLGVTLEDVDWGGQLIYVVSKGTRIRQPVPASPDAFRHLSRYLAAGGLPAAGEPVWRTRRGDPRPMTYWAMRRVLQRANERAGHELDLA